MNQNNINLSAIIIARNEEKRIGVCIDLLSFCNEIIVVNNGSIDKTTSIAQMKGCIVVDTKIKDFSGIRNVGKEMSRGSWLLYIDADETVSKELSHEIQKTIQTWKIGDPGSYTLCRKNYYLGTLWPKDEQMLRFFRRDSLEGWRGVLHESAIVNGKLGSLSGALLHDSHRSLEEMVAKTNEWSENEAALRFNVGHPAIVPWRLWRVMLTVFCEYYIVQGGWRVGTVGIIESIYQAFSMFITYAKLWEMQQNKRA
jgi:glycosyltransferase involved in cell wall biosynthesis